MPAKAVLEEDKGQRAKTRAALALSSAAAGSGTHADWTRAAMTRDTTARIMSLFKADCNRREAQH